MAKRGTALLLAACAPWAVAAQPSSGGATTGDGCDAGSAAPGWSWVVDAVPVADAVQRIANHAGWRLAYSAEALPARRVSVRCRAFDPRAALAVVLRGTGVRAEFRGALVILVPVGESPNGIGDPSRAQALPLTLVEATREGGPGWELAVPTAPAGTAVQRLQLDSLHARGVVTLGEALRGTIPGLTAWDRGGGSVRLASVRGRGTDGGPGIKVFVDGLEVADPSVLLAGDARTVASVEWLPGPAGAALYGGDALDGVLHLRTRASDGARGSEVTPSWTASVRGGQGAARYRPGDVRTGDLAATAEWRRGRRTVRGTVSAQYGDVPLPADPGGTANAAVSAALDGDRWQVAVTARGGGGRQRLAFAPQAPDATSGRTSVTANAALLDDERLRDAQVGVSGWHRTARIRQAWSLTSAFASRSAWTTGPRASVLDSLRGAWQGPVARQAARYTTTFAFGGRETTVAAPAALPLALQLSADGTHLRRAGPDSAGFANALGDSTVVQVAAGMGALLSGAMGPALWSAGVRGEWNSAFGTAARLAWLPTLGATVRRPWGDSGTWSVRGAFGASLRAPLVAMTAARTTSVFVQRANPALAGERLRGGEVGGALEGRRWLLDLTAFRQRTDGFTQLVSTGAIPWPDGRVRREVQYRTVGVLQAQGVELRARWSGRWGSWEGSGSTVQSRLLSLSADYRGPLQPGDAPLEAPQGTVAATWTGRWLGGRVAVGMSQLGAWQTRLPPCGLPGEPACGNDRVQRVDALARWQASYGRALPGGWQWRIRGENLGNNQRADGSALLVAPGRTVVVEVGRW